MQTYKKKKSMPKKKDSKSSKIRFCVDGKEIAQNYFGIAWVKKILQKFTKNFDSVLSRIFINDFSEHF